MAESGGRAGEAVGPGRIPRAVIAREPGVLADRPLQYRRGAVRREARGDQVLRRGTPLHPGIERAQQVDRPRIAARAVQVVADRGGGEHAGEAAHAVIPQALAHRIEIRRGAIDRHAGVRQPVPDQQLAAVGGERRQVRIGGVHHAGQAQVLRRELRGIVVQQAALRIALGHPRTFLGGHEVEGIAGLETAAENVVLPVRGGRAAAAIAWIAALAPRQGDGDVVRAVDQPDGFDLPRGQAGFVLGALAQQFGGYVVAGLRVADDAVLQAVQRIAGRGLGARIERDLLSAQPVLGPRENVPQHRRPQVHLVRLLADGRLHGDDAVVVLRVLLRGRQRRPTAVGVAHVVAPHRALAVEARGDGGAHVEHEVVGVVGMVAQRHVAGGPAEAARRVARVGADLHVGMGRRAGQLLVPGIVGGDESVEPAPADGEGLAVPGGRLRQLHRPADGGLRRRHDLPAHDARVGLRARALAQFGARDRRAVRQG